MKIEVEVTYALPDVQMVIPLTVESPATIEEVIRQSGILERFPDIRLEDDMVGIFGRYLSLDHPVSPNDRVEIYRPLFMSPTEARRARAQARRHLRGRA